MSCRVLYVVYWGAAEPLGRALVLPAVGRLASLGVDVTLVTFEKAADLDYDSAPRIGALLGDARVRWIPLRYHRRPKWPATAFDVAHGVARCIADALGRRPDIVHARTFVAGPIGIAVARLLGAKFVYHNEGFYPDEQVDAGVWRYGSPAHRLASALERQLYLRADGIVALSERARVRLRRLAARTPTIVVPSCVDLRLFPWEGPRPRRSDRSLRLVYLGSVGGRYRFLDVAAFAARAARRFDPFHLRVLTPGDPSAVASVLMPSGIPPELWSIASVPHAGIARELSTCDAGLALYAGRLSGEGCSPTKVGEYWAAGLPVVATPGLGDVEEVIRRDRVGVTLRGVSRELLDTALDELSTLLADGDLPQRCRAAAEAHYELETACRRQLALYEELKSDL